jgi:hypothetical protein
MLPGFLKFDVTMQQQILLPHECFWIPYAKLILSAPMHIGLWSVQVQFIAAGAQLTPEQQRAQQLQLPLTQPVRLQPGMPDPRALMRLIKVGWSP